MRPLALTSLCCTLILWGVFWTTPHILMSEWAHEVVHEGDCYTWRTIPFSPRHGCMFRQDAERSLESYRTYLREEYFFSSRDWESMK